ncbi:MAG TPA: hypothetical protein VET25_06765 [Aestuariivirgaceae bacterium]|nr:hypothetical protein [Aestuariivirgaceae bacterium]
MQSEKSIFVSLALVVLFLTPFFAYGKQPGLKTAPGVELGVTLSNYEYEEPTIAVTLEGYKLGLDFSAIGSAGKDWFIRADARYEYGETDYTGSGTQCCNPDWYYELRGTVGRDFDQGTYSLSPYLGVGYRYLFNDIRGSSSTGAVGYRRTSRYIYGPLGATHRLKLESNARLTTTLEYDFLIKGEQKSYLADTGITGLTDVVNEQPTGYGLRGSMYYEKNNWSFGPWIQYWNIDRSDTASAGIASGFEPENETTEIGLRLGLRF